MKNLKSRAISKLQPRRCCSNSVIRSSIDICGMVMLMMMDVKLGVRGWWWWMYVKLGMGCFKAGRALSGGLKGCRCAGAASTSALCTVMLCRSTVHCHTVHCALCTVLCALYTVQEEQAPALRSIFLQLLKGGAVQVRLRRCCSTCSFLLSLSSTFCSFALSLSLPSFYVVSAFKNGQTAILFIFEWNEFLHCLI